MTLAGSLLFGGYRAWERLCGKFATQRMHYRALVMVLLVYVVPWVWIQGVYSAMLTVSYRQETLTVGRMPVSYADISTQEEAFRTQSYWFLLVIVGIWVAGAAVRLFRKCRKYFHEKNGLLLEAKVCRNGKPEMIARRLRKELHCIWMPVIYTSPEVSGALTVGFLRPLIFLEEGYADTELEPILRHEMTHIARGDLLVKLLIELACCLHWFNPLIYKLKKRLELVCETSCDEKVVRRCNIDERAEYARLVVKNMRKDEQNTLLGSALENNYGTAEERVNLIMKRKKVKMLGKLAATFVFAAMLLVNSLTALAYPNVFHVDSDVAVDNAYIVGNYSMYGESGIDVPTDVILYDEQIIDKDGNIFPAGSASTYGVICSIFGHDEQDCYFESHIRNGSGGCEVKVYNARTCLKCNHIWVDSWYATYTYATCPH